jgi:hypothetical protein
MNSTTTATSRRTRRLIAKLSGYATVGAALGATETSAAVIYTDVGPDGIPLAGLDLNDDGENEFVLSTFFSRWTFGCHTTSSGGTHCETSNGAGHETDFLLQGIGGNRIVVEEEAPELIRTFAPGSPIDLYAAARSKGELAFYRYSSDANGACEFGCKTTGGNFIDGRRSFVGMLIEFDDQGPYSGWADIETVGAYGVYLLHGFAYETIPGKPIRAGAVPEPPSLVLLAAGAMGLAALRLKRSSTKSACARSGR